jgi:putative salt-induced outer membrane protein YdiY
MKKLLIMLISTTMLFADLTESVSDTAINTTFVTDTIDIEAKYSFITKYDYKIVPVKHLQNIEAGFSSTSGNTKMRNLNLKYNISHLHKNAEAQIIKYSMVLTTFLAQDNDKRTAEEYKVIFTSDRQFKNNWLAYLSAGWLKNAFKNYDDKVRIGIGIGKILFNDDQHLMVLKVGPGYNFENYRNGGDAHFSSFNQYFVYVYKFKQHSVLYLELGAMESFDDMSDDYEVDSLFGFDFKLEKNLHLTLEYEVNYNHLPSVGFDKTDTKSIIRLGYKF